MRSFLCIVALVLAGAALLCVRLVAEAAGELWRAKREREGE